MSTLFHRSGNQEVLRVDQVALGWQFLEFTVFSLAAGDHVDLDAAGREIALVPISGSGTVQVARGVSELKRRGVFEEMASVLYVPPGDPARLTGTTDWLVAVGSAPAEGRHPLRLIDPAEMKVEVRGGGPALRQVNHVLAPPLPAERLIVYEVYVPGGAWAGWPPHCHDGHHGSPYLEETYFFRFDRSDGFGFHRNYLADRSYDEVQTIHDLDCIAVPRGFHVTASSPGNTMWILNFLAGDLVDDDRATSPYYDPVTTWITDDWSKGQVALPIPLNCAHQAGDS